MHGLWSSTDSMEAQQVPVKSHSTDLSLQTSLMPLYDALTLRAQTLIISKVCIV